MIPYRRQGFVDHLTYKVLIWIHSEDHFFLEVSKLPPPFQKKCRIAMSFKADEHNEQARRPPQLLLSQSALKQSARIVLEVRWLLGSESFEGCGIARRHRAARGPSKSWVLILLSVFEVKLVPALILILHKTHGGLCGRAVRKRAMLYLENRPKVKSQKSKSEDNVHLRDQQ